MKVRVFAKPVGGVYKVVLRPRDVTPGQIARGVLGGSAIAPVPSMSAHCTCCDAPTPRTQDLVVTTDRRRTAPIAVPVCDACASHAFGGGLIDVALAFGFVVGISGALIGIGLGRVAIAVAALAAVLGLIAALVLGRSRRRRSARAGHHVGLAIRVAPYQTAVLTSNRRLVDELVLRNPSTISEVQ